MADGPQGGTRSARSIAIAAGVVVVVAVLVVWLVLRGGDGDKPAADSSASESPSQSMSRSASSSPVPTGNPTAKPPPVPKPPKKLPKPVRASLGSAAESGGLEVEVSRIESVKGKAEGLGERGGPSLRFTIVVTNKGSSQKNLDLAVVNAYYGTDDEPANELSGPGVKRLPQTLAPGKQASGRYVFSVPEGERDNVRLDFSYDIGEPLVVFTGSAS